MDLVPGLVAMPATEVRTISKIVIGLGNPGEQYAKTRHNIGWMVLDRLADRAGWSGRGRNKDAAAIVGGRFHGLDLLLVKPMTFMNDSGIAVRKVIARERAPLPEMLVVCDDFALPFGKLRFREGGGPGGHNGLRSIIDELASEGFSRLRVGIGEPGRGFAGASRNRKPPSLSRAATRWNPFELRPADADRLAEPGAVDGPPDAAGVRRTRTGWRKVRRADAADAPDGSEGSP